jgi:hypothetical protein
MVHKALWLAPLIILAMKGAEPTQAPGNESHEAKMHFDAGLAHIDGRDFEKALAEFRRAYELRPHYAVLYNVAKCLLELNDKAGALETFDAYLSEGTGQIPPARSAEVSALQATLASALGTAFVVSAHEGANLRIDGKDRGVLPLQHRLWLPLGPHVLAVVATGFLPHQQTFEVTAGREVKIRISLRPKPMEIRTGEVLFLCPTRYAMLTVDDKPLHLDDSARIRLNEGIHALTVTVRGRKPQLSAVVVKADQTVTYSCADAETAVNMEQPHPEQAANGQKPILKYATCGITAPLLISATSLWIWNGRRFETWQSEDTTLDHAAGPNGLPAEELRTRTEQNDERLHAVRRMDIITFALAIAGLAAASTCGFLALRSHQGRGN